MNSKPTHTWGWPRKLWLEKLPRSMVSCSQPPEVNHCHPISVKLEPSVEKPKANQSPLDRSNQVSKTSEAEVASLRSKGPATIQLSMLLAYGPGAGIELWAQ